VPAQRATATRTVPPLGSALDEIKYRHPRGAKHLPVFSRDGRIRRARATMEMSAEATSVDRHARRNDHLTMERMGSVPEPAYQASRHNSPEKDRPEPEK